MSRQAIDFGCVSVTSLEEKIEVILDYGNYENNSVKSLVEHLTSSLIGANHSNNSCCVNRKRLETLCTVLKILIRDNDHLKNSFNSEFVVDMCFSVFQNIGDGKDICLPIVYDILCYSLCLLPIDCFKGKIIPIMLTSKSELIDLSEQLSSVCMDSQYMSVEVTKLGINLKVWEAILSTLLAYLDKSNNSSIRSDLLDLFDDKFMERLLNIVGFEHDILSSQTLLCVIPKLVAFTQNNTIIKSMWENIVNQFNTGEYINHVTSHMYLILCTWSELFIPCSGCPTYSYPVLEKRDFWKILQYGLVSSDALMRKQALYLLKRSVELHIHSHKSSLANIFWWNDEKSHQFEKVWNNMFLMLEVLEEKQMHLVEPVQPILQMLVDACHKSLIHSSWIFCVVQRALTHDCNAVVKWSLMCLTELELHKIMTCDLDYRFIFSSLMSALNAASLYGMPNNTSVSVPKTVYVLKSFLIAVAENEKGDKCTIFSSLFDSLIHVSWGPVALFYVVYALAAVPKCPVWSINYIKLMKKFLLEALATQIVHIRGAIQTFFIDTLINLADEKHLDVKTLADIFGSIKRREALKRGSHTWHKVVTWLKTFLKGDDAVMFAQKCFSCVINGQLECEIQSAARIIILLMDAGFLDFNSLKLSSNRSNCSLYSLTQYFENCHERLYICPVKQNSCLDMLISLLEESQPIRDGDGTGQNIIALISSIVPGIFYCVERNMFAACNLENFDTVNLHVRALKIISDEPKMLSCVLKNASKIQDAGFSIMKAGDSTPVSKYFALKALSWISDLIKLITTQSSISLSDNSKVLREKHVSFSEYIFQRQNFNQILVKTSNETFLTRDLQMLWGKLVSEYLQTMWHMLFSYIELQEKLCGTRIEKGLAHCIWVNACEALEIGGRGMLIPVMTVIQRVIHLYTTPQFSEELQKFLDLCWNDIFELRKSELFWSALEKFVKMTFQDCCLKEVCLQDTLLRYAEELFVQGETVTGICNVLLLQLQEIAKCHDSTLFEPFVGILVDSVLFGPVHRRDRKIDDETCAFIRSLGGKCCINDIMSLCSDTEVRGRAIQLILYFQCSASSSDMKVLSKVFHKLLEKDSDVSQKKPRYFVDSYHHRYRHRVMQILLLIENSLAEDERTKLASYIQNSLLNENHQLSIRYLQEWILTRILLKDSSFRSHIWSMLQMASETRPASLCSFISIIYHTSCALPLNNELENFMDVSMREMVPHSMTQHFNVRLFAQTSFVKLWEYAHKLGYIAITTKYAIIYSCMKKNLSNPCALKSFKKLEEFYFSTFHPIEHYSLQTIFYDLPRLTSITHEEWISHDVLHKCGNEKSCVPLLSKNSDLQYEDASYTVKTDVLNCDSEVTNNDVTNIQKKIIPWRAMFPDPELLMSEAVLRRKQTISENGLIVVASLIDKLPNLGGLCRTCEAFGVFQYVLGSIKYIEDKQFQVLSVTSEQWVSITEVKPNDLSNYLKSMKHEGYTIVGAEQTAKSLALNEVKFPKRTVLLLGNEKEGIPINLLPLLDICVEVPQQGVIRSLNVHVTGAIFIWEYARQHNIAVSS